MSSGGDAQPLVSGANTVPPRSARAVRIATLTAVGAAVVLTATIGVRVKQATSRRAQVAEEAQAARARQLAAKAHDVVSPAPMRYRPTVPLAGTLRPWREADLGFQTQGRLSRVAATLGSSVKAGDVLAILDTSMAAAQLTQAQSQAEAAGAQLALAEDNFRRTQALVQSKALPEVQLAQARQQLEAARAQRGAASAGAQMAKVGQGQHALVAPFAGVITRAPTGVGMIVNPLSPASMGLIRVEDLTRLRLSTTIGERDVDNVRVGAEVTFLYRGAPVKGLVTTLVRSLDPGTRRAPIEIEVDNAREQLLAWSFVRGQVDSGKEIDAFKLPGTVRRPGSQDELVAVEGGRAKVLVADFVTQDDGSLVVRSGISGKEQFVVAPPDDVKDGAPIELSKAPEGG